MEQPSFEEFVRAHFDDVELNGEYLLRVCGRDFYDKVQKEYDGNDVSSRLDELLTERDELLDKGDKYEMFVHGYPLLRAMYDSLFRYEPDVYDQVEPNAPWEGGD